MQLLWVAESVYIGVVDVTAARAWYEEKLGLRFVVREDGDGCVSLVFSKKESSAITLGPRDQPIDDTVAMFNTSDIRKAHEVLSSRGVSVGAIQQDRQGTQFFEFRDLDGNQLEVNEAP